MAADPFTCDTCTKCADIAKNAHKPYLCGIMGQYIAKAADCDIHSDRIPNPIQEAPTHLCKLMSLPYPVPEEAIA